jgi:hypothetical protein
VLMLAQVRVLAAAPSPVLLLYWMRMAVDDI